MLQRSRIEREDDGSGDVLLHTPVLYVASRGEQQLLLAGSVRHRLVRTVAGWAIRQKRVDLLNAGRALPAIQLFI